MRAFTDAVAAGDKAKATETLRAAVKKVDQVAAKGSLHKNTASRRKSRLQKKLNAALAKASRTPMSAGRLPADIHHRY